jgi:hypothetical protein
MRPFIPISAITFVLFKLTHADDRYHHIDGSCWANPLWQSGYPQAVKLMQLTVNLLKGPNVPPDLVNVIKDLWHDGPVDSANSWQAKIGISYPSSTLLKS